jgi:hypothetical protein
MIYLYVKGAATEALQAVNSHGIHSKDILVGPFTYVPHGMRSGYVISEFFVRDECRPGVDRWYDETLQYAYIAIASVNPFPPGTLLSYDRDYYRPKH